MSQRSENDLRNELDRIKDAHLANEAQRDGFIAVGHTALFAASIGFMGGLDKIQHSEQVWVLCGAWISSVIGMLSLTFSFWLAERYNNARRSGIHEADPPSDAAINFVNALALWTFPASMVLLTIYAGVNIF